MLIENVKQMNEMVLGGQIPQAVDKFFANDATTKDVDGGITKSKQEALDKLTGFVGSIENVKEITLHNSAVGDDVSLSEFTFHFDMKDGSEVLWNEVIRRKWRDGQVVDERYFQN